MTPFYTNHRFRKVIRDAHLGKAWARMYADLMTRIIALLLLAIGVLGLATGLPRAAEACPGCKEALASQSEVDTDPDADTLAWNPAYAYSYSVLFMLAVPAGILITFGTAAYRMTRRSAQPPDVLDWEDRSS